MDKILQHLNFIIDTLSKTNSYLYPKQLTSTQLFCLGLFERLYNGCLSFQLLFDRVDKIPQIEFTIGITTRALLLDTLISMNLYRIYKDLRKQGKSAEEIEAVAKLYCETILSDGIDKTFDYLQMAKDLGYIDEIHLQKSFNNMAVVHKPFLEAHNNDGTRPQMKIKGYYSPTKLFKELAQTKDLKNVATLYDTYLFFSKYDHFGSLYYHAIREDFSKKTDTYKNAFEAYVASMAFLHIVLEESSPKDDFLLAQGYKTNKYLFDEIIEKQ